MLVVPLVWINTYAPAPMRSGDGVSDSQWVAAVGHLLAPTHSMIASHDGMAIVIAGLDGKAIVMARARMISWSLELICG